MRSGNFSACQLCCFCCSSCCHSRCCCCSCCCCCCRPYHLSSSAEKREHFCHVKLSDCAFSHYLRFASSAVPWLLLFPFHAVSPVVCHLACHTHAADTHTLTHTHTPTQNVIKSCHAGLRLSFAFPFAFASVSVSAACAYISITLESMQHFNETPYCHLSNSDGPTGVTNVNYFILLPSSCAVIEIWAQHVGERKKGSVKLLQLSKLWPCIDLSQFCSTLAHI